MVRVVYRWQVVPQDFDSFIEAWRKTTNQIHETVAGAHGSFLLKSIDNQSEIVTIAKWDSLESWENFWGNSNPKEMEGLGMIGKRISVDVFEEVEDHTR